MTAPRHPGITVRVGARDFVMGPTPAQLMRTALPDIMRLEQRALSAAALGDLAGAADAALNTLAAELALIAASMHPEVSVEDLEEQLGFGEIAQLFAQLVQMSSSTTGLPSACIFSRSSCCLPGRLSDEREEYSKSMTVNSPRVMTTTSDLSAS